MTGWLYMQTRVGREIIWPSEVDGFQLSTRSMYLLYAPISWLLAARR